MRALLQRARTASVTVDGTVTGHLDSPGLVVLLGVSAEDTEAEARQLAEKTAHLRVLEDEASLVSAGAGALVVSQFTLYGDVRRGRRPSWSRSARGDHAEPLYELFMAELERAGVPVERGVFGAMMDVALVNSGPFTVWVDTDELKGPRRG
ncbi:D-aminoacyl-tRNA deacylase [Citricoccus nitrophenolicus]|uniref:D-aminoacyl-tRNA deacylase n=1 Tax=Citricoccus nitrophenolicus TaxID=863575 RepID=A0ABV0IM84_9MICC|nr:D-aminoacyl-tRNA deacylase [Citricoccus sp. I39-566]NUL48633.1 D-tyrosyl-tRNA(Tyr) deacylase [Cellulosimicrobium funkei]WMY77512.1 D-aminoacyl-tRNA deacylase [Citricoccus sp. I39-566]